MHKTLILVCLLIAGPIIAIAAEPVSRQQAASIAESQFQGRVIAVEESKQNNVPVFRVKVLDKQGGLHTVIIDHQTGNVISAH
jgi:uncharacterized membrane protein YkoI